MSAAAAPGAELAAAASPAKGKKKLIIIIAAVLVLVVVVEKGLDADDRVVVNGGRVRFKSANGMKVGILLPELMVTVTLWQVSAVQVTGFNWVSLTDNAPVNSTFTPRRFSR